MQCKSKTSQNKIVIIKKKCGKGSKYLCALTSIGVWLQRCVSMLTVVDISMPSYVEIFIH